MGCCCDCDDDSGVIDFSQAVRLRNFVLESMEIFEELLRIEEDRRLAGEKPLIMPDREARELVDICAEWNGVLFKAVKSATKIKTDADDRYLAAQQVRQEAERRRQEVLNNLGAGI